MHDPRINQLADQFINYSAETKPGDVVLIEYDGTLAMEQARACAEYAVKAGAVPIVQDMNLRLRNFTLHNANEKQIQKMGELSLDQMQKVDVYIAIRGAENIYELHGVPQATQDLFTKHVQKPVTDYRVNNTRWAITRYPTPSMAQLAESDTKSFEDFYFNVCCLDYSKMNEAVQPLKKLMEATDQVRITGPETDLTFSIKNIAAIPCVGHRNIPDGECFTAPVKDSINGTVLFNAKTNDRESGTSFEFIKITFKDGKAVNAEAEDAEKTKKLNTILDRDEGARYIGEFAIAFNPHILHPMNDILFDEKIQGSFHMAFGQCYKTTDNGNDSVVHWDLVQIQRPDYGGGEIYFDDKLIRKDGLFVIPELAGLNPDKLG